MANKKKTNRKSTTTHGFIYGSPFTFSSYYDRSGQSPYRVHSFQLGLQSRCLSLRYNGDPAKKLHLLDVVGRQRLQSSSTSHRRVAEP